MKARMLDLAIEALQDGGLRLEQSAGYDETAVILLHPLQARLLAETAGLLDAPAIPRELARRLARLREHAAELVDFLGAVPSFPPSADIDEDVRRAIDLLAELDEMLEDFTPAESTQAHRTEPAETEPEQPAEQQALPL